MNCGERIKENVIIAVMEQLKELYLEAEKKNFRPRRDSKP